MANTLKFGNGEWYGKKDTILAYNDENYNYKPLPFSFERASSATVVNKAGLIETVGSGEPRIDYSDDVNGALKLEPTRTNIITNSNSNNLNFTLDAVSMTYNSIVSPDGEINGILLKQTGSNSSNSAYNFGLTTANGTYTYSIFLKANDSERIRIYSSNGTTLVQDFNPQEMTEGVLSGDLNLDFKSYGNDWFRVSFTRTQSSAPYHRLSIYPDRLNTQKSVYIFGLQIELNVSYPTSYIPTSGSAVTRLAESCSQTVPDGVIGQTEGTMYWEGKFQDAQNPILMQMVPSSANYLSSIYIEFNKATNSIRFNIYDSGVIQTTLTTSATPETKYKIALAYKQNDIQGYVNGVSIGSDTNATIQSGLNNLLIGGLVGYVNNNTFIGTKPNNVRLYNTRLSNSELQKLTTI